MDVDADLKNCHRMAELIREAADIGAYIPGQEKLSVALHELALELTPSIEQDTAQILPFPKSPYEVTD